MDVKQQILQSAFLCLTRQAVTSMRLTDVARQTGIGRTALYYYFSSKEEILQALKVSLQHREMDAFHQLHGAVGPVDLGLLRWLDARLGLIPETCRGQPEALLVLDQLCPEDSFINELANWFEQVEAAGRIQLADKGLSAQQAASLVLHMAKGIFANSQGEWGNLRQRMTQMAVTLAAGWGAKASLKPRLV